MRAGRELADRPDAGHERVELAEQGGHGFVGPERPRRQLARGNDARVAVHGLAGCAAQRRAASQLVSPASATLLIGCWAGTMYLSCILIDIFYYNKMFSAIV